MLECKLILNDNDSLQSLLKSLKSFMADNEPSTSSQQTSPNLFKLKKSSRKISQSINQKLQQFSSADLILVEIDAIKLSAKRYSISTKKWFDLPSLSGNFDSSGIACAGNVLYILGGADSKFCSLDLSKQEWVVGGSTPRERQNFGCAVSESCIYVAGGINSHSRLPFLKSVECYNIHDDGWTKMTSMNYYRADCCLIVYEDKLYALGGKSRAFIHDAVEIFDGKKWSSGPSMLRSRTDFAAVVVDNRLYAIGGKSWLEYSEVYCREVEAYTFEEKKWSYVAKLNIPRAGHGACVANGKIYVAGGASRKGWKMPMELYDPCKDIWKEMNVKTDPKRVVLATASNSQD